jgi:thiosulfate/3-mercaptopyruvate sulfurtransferase
MVVSEPLVTTGWLAEHLGAPDVAVIDASWFLPPTDRDARQEFIRGHIPGAVFFDIDAISDQTTGLPHMLADPEQFQSAARTLGVSQSSRVIVYDSQGLFSAPRVWWNFRVMGHRESYVLDGGLPRWLAEGRPLEAGERSSTEGDFVARLAPALVRNLAAMRATIAGGDEQIVDARSAARFAGSASEPRPGLRSGHMPGARNLPWAEVVDADGRMKPPDKLRQAFETAGVDLTRPIVTSCGSGVSAAVLALALARIGRDDVAIYDGSWAEWGSLADTPVVCA